MDITAEISGLLKGPRFPDKEFVSSGITFGEVYAMAGSLHRVLSGPEYRDNPVCLATEDRALLAAAILASLAGGPSLLLPYALSAAALHKLFQLTGFTAAVADDGRDLPEGVTVVRPEQGRYAQQLPASRKGGHSELLKIFTGGTTGAPRIWSKTGENICGEGFFLARSFGITEQDTLVATVPPYHIYGLLFSVVLPLVSGAAIAAETPFFPEEIAAAVRQNSATILVSIPAHYRVLRERSMADTSLRLAFSSAGMLDAEDNEIFCRLNNVAIAEVYGSTETGGIAVRNRFAGEACFTPFPVVDWRIRDQRLCVLSPFLSPDLPRTDKGFFMTGDRVEPCGANGFALLGRIDGVTKVGGKRVDLEEVRTAIRQIPGVADCVVMALPEAGGRESTIVALVQGNAVDIDLIRKELSGSLEPAALPRLIRPVTEIPLLDNGKYDRKAIVRLFAP